MQIGSGGTHVAAPRKVVHVFDWREPGLQHGKFSRFLFVTTKTVTTRYGETLDFYQPTCFTAPRTPNSLASAR
jgi:hypothetical protein